MFEIFKECKQHWVEKNGPSGMDIEPPTLAMQLVKNTAILVIYRALAGNPEFRWSDRGCMTSETKGQARWSQIVAVSARFIPDSVLKCGHHERQLQINQRPQVQVCRHTG